MKKMDPKFNVLLATNEEVAQELSRLLEDNIFSVNAEEIIRITKDLDYYRFNEVASEYYDLKDFDESLNERIIWELSEMEYYLICQHLKLSK